MSTSETGAKLDIGPALIDAFQDGLIVRDACGRIRDVNQAFCAQVGYPADELVGQAPPNSFWPADQLAAFHAGLVEVLAGKRWERDLQYVRRDGSRIDVIVSTSPILGADQRPCGSLAVVKDITGRNQQQRELAHAKEAAEAASRAKDRFLAVLSHELRAPLAPVTMAIEQLRSMPLPGEATPLIDLIKRNLEMETRLIDDLLDLTHVSRRRLHLRFEPVDIHRVVAEVLESSMPGIRLKQLKLDVEWRSQRHHVLGDQVRLHQIFNCLLNNAVKFTPPGGRIALRTFDDNHHLVVEIQDTGIGIAPEMLARLFQAFEQEEGPVFRRHGGLGLGLAVCRTLVRQHWGQITACSEGTGAGATFTVRLPSQDRPSELSSEMAPANPRHEPPSTGKPRRILVVEDHDDTRFLLCRMLERFGYEVHSADCLAAAGRLIQDEPLDLLVSDIGLPDGSGLDVMVQVRHRWGPRVRGIAVSGFGTDEDIRRSKQAGFEQHFVKPIRMETLRKALSELSEASPS